MSRIVSFEQDDSGPWVARLACGHARHVRHQPPFQLAAWVTSEAGRAAKIGCEMSCQFCRMPALPEGAQVYKQTATFDASNVPSGLLASHTLKPGTWGRIVVHEGRVAYTLEDEDDFTVVLRPGVAGTIAPQRPHHVTPQPGARFRVEFLRERS